MGSELVAILYTGKPSPRRQYLSRDLKEADHSKDKSKVTIKMSEDQVSLIFLWCYSILSKFNPHAMLTTLLLSQCFPIFFSGPTLESTGVLTKNVESLAPHILRLGLSLGMCILIITASTQFLSTSNLKNTAQDTHKRNYMVSLSRFSSSFQMLSAHMPSQLPSLEMSNFLVLFIVLLKQYILLSIEAKQTSR